MNMNMDRCGSQERDIDLGALWELRSKGDAYRNLVSWSGAGGGKFGGGKMSYPT